MQDQDSYKNQMITEKKRKLNLSLQFRSPKLFSTENFSGDKRSFVKQIHHHRDKSYATIQINKS